MERQTKLKMISALNTLMNVVVAIPVAVVLIIAIILKVPAAVVARLKELAS